MKVIQKLIKQSKIQELKNSLEDVVENLERIIGEDIRHENSDLRSMFENTMKNVEKRQSQIRDEMKGDKAREIRDLIIESWQAEMQDDQSSRQKLEKKIMDKMEEHMNFERDIPEDEREDDNTEEEQIRDMFRRRMAEIGTKDVNEVTYNPAISKLFNLQKKNGSLDVDRLEDLLFGDASKVEYKDPKANYYAEDQGMSFDEDHGIGLDFDEVKERYEKSKKSHKRSDQRNSSRTSKRETRKKDHENEWANPKQTFEKTYLEDRCNDDKQFKGMNDIANHKSRDQRGGSSQKDEWAKPGDNLHSRSEMDEAKDFLNQTESEDPFAKERDQRDLTDALSPLIKSGALVSVSRVNNGDVILEVRDTYRDPNKGWTSDTKEIRVSVNEKGDITFSKKR